MLFGLARDGSGLNNFDFYIMKIVTSLIQFMVKLLQPVHLLDAIETS
jgi:hypothetical protein